LKDYPAQDNDPFNSPLKIVQQESILGSAHV